MGSTPVGHMIFYVALFIIVMIAIYVLIQVVITQVAFWILRPSEMFSMDLVGTVTALSGTTGEVTTDFRTYTANVTYYVKKINNIVCVIAQRKRTMDSPVIGTLTTFHCFSMSFIPQFDFNPSSPVESYEFSLKKIFQDPFIKISKG